MALKLKVRCGENPRIAPLVDGTVKPKDIELEFDFTPVDVLFYKNIKFDDFEVSEMSISETLLSRDRREKYGNGRWNWSAIPIYLSRGHLWTSLYAGANSGIKSLADLKGRKVGFPDYCMTGALWFKITLKDVYGIEAGDIAWSNMRPAGASQGIELGLETEPPTGVQITWLTDKHDPVAMVENGELDAAANLPADRIRNNPKLVRVLPDGGKQIISQYYRDTQCFQPNHHYVIQDRIVQENPWVPMALFEAYQESKRVAFERARRSLSTYLYFEGNDYKEQAAVFGEDPYPFGLKAMRKSFDRAVKGSMEQGMIKRPIAMEDLYHPTTLGT
jgi:4,5-dihydroxyphthalate decarboxylase